MIDFWVYELWWFSVPEIKDWIAGPHRASDVLLSGLLQSMDLGFQTTQNKVHLNSSKFLVTHLPPLFPSAVTQVKWPDMKELVLWSKSFLGREHSVLKFVIYICVSLGWNRWGCIPPFTPCHLLGIIGVIDIPVIAWINLVICGKHKWQFQRYFSVYRILISKEKKNEIFHESISHDYVSKSVMFQNKAG